MQKMTKLEYKVRFVTPAFLGNAEQNGQWRTPPFKALLRQWWRVGYAAHKGADLNVSDMRQKEGMLFGNAWLESGGGKSLFCKSQIALRLAHWKVGDISSESWPGGQVESVTTTKDGKGRVRSDVYLGFGPVMPPSKKENRSSITIRRAIGINSENILQILPDRKNVFADSEQDMTDVHNAVQLMAWFGTLGSRSRNGWGSIRLEAIEGTKAVSALPSVDDPLLNRIVREWTECLPMDWPHALGLSGGKPLVWLTRPFPDWRKVMGCLANVRVDVRRVAKAFSDGSKIGGIHLLGYPAGGKWAIREFSKGQPKYENQEGRLTTQLRFKVVQTTKGLIGAIFHVPHRFPEELFSRLSTNQQTWLSKNEQEVWQAIHDALNMSSRLDRFGD